VATSLSQIEPEIHRAATPLCDPGTPPDPGIPKHLTFFGRRTIKVPSHCGTALRDHRTGPLHQTGSLHRGGRRRPPGSPTA